MAEPTSWPWAQIPEDVGAAMRPSIPALVDAVIAAVRAEVPEYGRPLQGEFGRLIHTGTASALEQFMALFGRDLPPGDLRLQETLGRAEHRQGRTLDALQSAYRVGARVTWRHMVALGEAKGLDPPVVYLLGESIFVYIERLSAASVAGFTQEEALRAGSVQERRYALIDRLAAGAVADPAATRAARARRALGAARAARGAGDRRGRPGRARAAGCRSARSARRSSRSRCCSSRTRTDPGSWRGCGPRWAATGAALGPTVAWPETHRSVAQATAAWALHARGKLGDEPLVAAGEQLLALLLTADEALTDDLLRRLEPLTALPEPARSRALTTLKAWFAAHGNVTLAAEALHVHPQTLRHRLARLQERVDLDDPRLRLELELALRAADLTD